jgi:hypothetical protein
MKTEKECSSRRRVTPLSPCNRELRNLETRKGDTKVYVARAWSARYDKEKQIPEYTKEHHDAKLAIFDIPELQYALNRGNMKLSSKGGDHLFPMREMFEEYGCIGSISKFNLLGISQEYNRGWKGSTKCSGSPTRSNVVALVFLPDANSPDLISNLSGDLKVVYNCLARWKEYCEGIGVTLFHRLPPHVRTRMNEPIEEGYALMLQMTRRMLDDEDQKCGLESKHELLPPSPAEAFAMHSQ